MQMSRRSLLASLSAASALSAAPIAMATATDPGKTGTEHGRFKAPLVIAHRGASGYLPEHTLAAYWMAIEMGADYIEPDLVSTKDGVLVARHENAIALLNADGSVREATTDVAERPEFASRRATKTIDGTPLTGWFTEDFTLAELRTLRARERLPALRVANTRFDGMFPIPTLAEILQLVVEVNQRRRERANGKAWRPLGVYPETKHPSYFQGIGLALEEPLVRLLHRYGFNSRQDPVFIQSFETANLRKLAGMTRLPLVQLLNGSGQPWDFTVSGDKRSYADLAQPVGLAEIASYAQGIGANTNLMIPLVGGRLGTPTTLVRDAHAASLVVHGWTFRAENQFLPDEFDHGSDPAALGNLAGQIKAFLDLGLDGFFTDQAFLGVQARDAWLNRR
jgi:glycerophosphoryl diester phosphodiesterase